MAQDKLHGPQDPSPTESGRARRRSGTRRPRRIAAAVLAALVLAVFFPILGFSFFDLDVPEQVIHNPYVHGLTAENVLHILTRPCIYSYYPVRTLSYAVDYQLWGLNPFGFKLTNLLIHLANVLLVYGLILRMLRMSEAGGRSGRAWWDAAVAALGTGLFAIHPVVVEPVTWVAGREELLMTLGALAAFHLHLSARRLADEPGRRAAAVACHAGAAAACALAVFSNAAAAAIPLVVTAWDVLVLPRPKLRRIVLGTAALWAAGVAAFVLKKSLDTVVDTYAAEVGLWTARCAMLVLSVYGQNVKTLLWPAALAIDYPQIVPQSFLEPEVVLGAAAAGGSLLAVWLLRRRTLLVFGLLWFGLALAPSAQVVPHHLTRADRFLYLPLVGLGLLVASALTPLGSSSKTRTLPVATMVAAIAVLLALEVRSIQQVQTWRDSLTVWEHCLSVYPSSAMAHFGVADNLAGVGLLREAKPHYEAAVKLNPGYTALLNNYVRKLASYPDERLRDYGRAIELATRGCAIAGWKSASLRRTLALARMNYATSLKNRGQLAAAAEYYRKAIEADPEYEVPLWNLALLLATSSDPKLRDPAEGVRRAEEALAKRQSPDPVQLAILATVYAQAGRASEAKEAQEAAMRAFQAAEGWQKTPESGEGTEDGAVLARPLMQPK